MSGVEEAAFLYATSGQVFLVMLPLNSGWLRQFEKNGEIAASPSTGRVCKSWVGLNKHSV